MRKNAFISFDYDHDDFLRTAIAGQAKHPDSPFDITDRSVKEHLPGDWKTKVRARIQRADLVIVICGEYTHTAQGVEFELKVAKELNKPYFLLKGYPDKNCFPPMSADTQDKIYLWTWPNLKALIEGRR